MKETQTFEYDSHKINEVKKCSRDIIYFVENYVKIKSIANGEESLIVLYKKQREVLKTMSESKKFCLEAARQSGKTLLSQLYILWKCNFHENSKCVMVSMTNCSCGLILSQLEYFQSTIPDWLKCNAIYNSSRWTNENFINFDNGSSIGFSTGSNFNPRGRNLSVLIFDEYSFYSELDPSFNNHGIRANNLEVLDIIKNSIISTMEGQLIATGTKAPGDSVFGLITKVGKGFTSWSREHMNWDDVPDRGLKWKDEMIECLGQKMFEQEFCV